MTLEDAKDILELERKKLSGHSLLDEKAHEKAKAYKIILNEVKQVEEKLDKSLKAWDKVIKDINGYIEYHKNEINKDEENRFLRYLIIDTYINALATIDNHLSEVKNG